MKSFFCITSARFFDQQGGPARLQRAAYIAAGGVDAEKYSRREGVAQRAGPLGPSYGAIIKIKIILNISDCYNATFIQSILIILLTVFRIFYSLNNSDIFRAL